MNVKINQSDLRSLNSKIKFLRSIDKQKLSSELGRAALDISRTAKKTVKVDSGNLKQSITTEVQSKRVSVIAGANYAPYVEFGTGGLVDLTDMKELGIPESYAAQFKGKGIREVNLPARPFLFNSARIGLNKLMNRLKKIINKRIN